MVRHAPKPAGAPHAPRGSPAKKPKLKLRDLISRVPTADEQDALHAAVFDGPPLAAAILGHAMVELVLDDLLRHALKRRAPNAWSQMTVENGPLDTFYRKIIFGRALDLYGDATYDHLNRIRMIRNVFAHAKTIIDFDDPAIVSELREAVLPDKKYSDLHRDIRRVRSKRAKGRDAYVALCVAAYVVIIGRLTRGLKAQSKNHKRAMAKLLTANPFAMGFLPKGPIANTLVSLLRNHNAGPNDPARPIGGLFDLGAAAMRGDIEDT